MHENINIYNRAFEYITQQCVHTQCIMKCIIAILRNITVIKDTALSDLKY